MTPENNRMKRISEVKKVSFECVEETWLSINYGSVVTYSGQRLMYEVRNSDFFP